MNFIGFTLINIVKIIKYAILIRILVSWVQPYGVRGKAYQILYEVTEPTMGFFRKILPSTGMIDFSPILAFFAMDMLEMIIISIFQ